MYNIKTNNSAGVTISGSGNVLVSNWLCSFSFYEQFVNNNLNKIIRLENDGITYSNEPVENIYGIDKDTEAIKIAAFSLYLTFLNYLEPVEIRNEYLIKKRKKLIITLL